MVLVPATEFFMGVEEETSGSDRGRTAKAGPFYLDRLEVSVEQYLKCRAAGQCVEPIYEERGCNASGKRARLQHPMNCITWKEAQRYCAALGKRLPSSPEWELAARGTDKRPYPWGVAKPKEQLCWQGRKGKNAATTCPVGGFPQGASPYGVLDMAGNVAEWTTTIIAGAGPAPIYDTRGGSFERDPMEDPDWPEVRSDLRGGSNPVEHEKDVGWRCAADVP